ncbi:MAG TPA: OmpA family protein [Hyphomonadaceae bacterium]|nr:OmpA family protein [Hyphomonadaceae bacterium]
MGQTNPSFRDPYARQKPGGAGAFALAPDHFRDQAARKAAKAAMPKPAPKAREPRSAKLKPVDAAPVVETPVAQRPVSEKRGPFFGAFTPKAREAVWPETFDKDLRRELVENRERKFSNSASLKVVTPEGNVDLAPSVVHGGDRLVLRRGGKKGKSSSLVLVSATNTVAAAEAVIDADFEDQPAEVSEKRTPKRERLRRGGGGGAGGGGSGGGGGIRPPMAKIDRAFNQDDLVSVLIVLALLLLFGIFLIRGNGAPTQQPQQLASVQSAAVEPAPPVGPPPDPHGDQPLRLVPAPVAPAPAPAPAPVPACKAGHTMRAWFCTNEAQLTDKAKAELEKEVTDWNSCFKDRELVVSGYADTRGPTDYNTWLGGERAKTIADFLKSRGIKVAQLQPVGELDGLDDNQNCSNQRRVDIMFKGDEAEAPSRSCAPPSDFAALVCG